jgi:hypothetical protein
VKEDKMKDTKDELGVGSGSCGDTLESHLQTTRIALGLVGAGLRCVEQYQALLILAEEARIIHGHPVYDPGPMAQIEAEKARELLRQTKERQRVMESEIVSFVPGNGKMH